MGRGEREDTPTRQTNRRGEVRGHREATDGESAWASERAHPRTGEPRFEREEGAGGGRAGARHRPRGSSSRWAESQPHHRPLFRVAHFCARHIARRVSMARAARSNVETLELRSRARCGRGGLRLRAAERERAREREEEAPSSLSLSSSPPAHQEQTTHPCVSCRCSRARSPFAEGALPQTERVSVFYSG